MLLAATGVVQKKLSSRLIAASSIKTLLILPILHLVYSRDATSVNSRPGRAHVPFRHPEGKHGWMFGLVWREKNPTACGIQKAYGRVGCLYFHTGRPVEEWRPVSSENTITIL
jgi:hypothetical protein